MSDNTPAGRVSARVLGYRGLLAKRPDCWPGDKYGKGGGAEYVSDLSAILAQREALLEALIEARSQLEQYEQERSGETYSSQQINAAITLATGEAAPISPAIG